jgi:hypothetical protein
MRSSDDSTLSSSHNAFSPFFLHRIGENDEPPTAGEADAAGPWRVLELPGRGFGLFRIGESPERGHQPAARFGQCWLALLAAAVLPGTGRDTAFRLQKNSGPEGFTVETGNGGKAVGHLTLFDERLIEALHVAEGLLRSPEALAALLEAAGQVALERAGAILDARIPT